MEQSEAWQRAFEIAENNLTVREIYANLLNFHADVFSKQDVEDFARDCGLDTHAAFEALLAAACGFESDRNPRHRALEERWFKPALRRLEPKEYRENEYAAAVSFPEKTRGRWRMTHKTCRPYELFCYDDTRLMPDGRELLSVGYFDEAFEYPAVLEDERLWMAITPNEVETMRRDILAAHGRTAVFGLGLGYYAFAAARKKEVESVTVIEREQDIIDLFSEELLPQFPEKDKIAVVKADAFDYLRSGMQDCDFAYIDLWHDVSDGTEMYLKCKALEKYAPKAEYRYWIEDSMLIWLRGLIVQEARLGEGRLIDWYKKYPEAKAPPDPAFLKAHAGELTPDMIKP